MIASKKIVKCYHFLLKMGNIYFPSDHIKRISILCPVAQFKIEKTMDRNNRCGCFFIFLFIDLNLNKCFPISSLRVSNFMTLNIMSLI